MSSPAGARRFVSRRLRRAAGLTLAACSGALVLFHGGLLWRRLADASILEPVVAARWLGALLLVAVLARLRALGLPLFTGRRALVLWLLVLLLHLGAPAADPGGWQLPPLLLLPVAVLGAAILAAISRAGFWTVGGRGGRPRRRLDPLGVAGPFSGFFAPLFSQPPPVRA